MESNESIGLKILALRKTNGTTQAELGQHLNVSYQAVSKWERGESLPDFDTLSKIAKFFNVPITYFENGVAQEPDEDEEETEEVEEQGKMLGVCKDCGKVVYEGDEGATSPELVCARCVDRRKRIAQAKVAEARRQEEKRRQQEREQELYRQEEIIRGRNKGLIWGAIAAALMIALGIFCIIKVPEYGIGALIGGALTLAFLAFTFVSQLFWEGAVVDVVLCGGKIIGTPGIIFTFDLDGFAFLIGMKILFALLRFSVWLITILFFAFIGIIISPFTFIPALHRVNSGDLVY